MKKWTLNDIPDLSGKNIIVTGGNSGIGFEAVKAFAKNGANVVLASRSIERGVKAKEEILNIIGKAEIEVIQLDLMDLESINTFVEKFKEKYAKLDVLLNNAGIMTVPYELTKDGFESQLGTNHLGHFALTAQLFSLLKSTSGSRIVNISSAAHKWGDMDFDNLQFENGKDYTPMKSYARSKLSNLLFTYELNRKLEQNQIDCITLAAHPGVSNTNLGRHVENKLVFKFLRPLINLVIPKPDMGALPGIRACVDPKAQGGEYYGPGGFQEMFGYPVIVSSNGNSYNLEYSDKLWKVSERLTKLQFDF